MFTSIYRRLKGHLLNDFVAELSRYSHTYKNIILSGDLNCNLLSDNFEARYLRNFIFSSSLFLVQSSATYHTATNDSWLDVFILDSQDKLLSFVKSDTPFFCGHDLLQLTFALDSGKFIPRTIYRRTLNRFNPVDYSNTIASTLHQAAFVDSRPLVSPNSLEVHCELFTQTILTALNNHAPLRTFPIRKPPAPWLTDALKGRIKKRNRLYKQARRSNDLLGLAIYRNFRDQLTLDMRSARQQYHLDRLNAIDNPSRLWGELSNLGLIKLSFSSLLHFFLLTS